MDEFRLKQVKTQVFFFFVSDKIELCQSHDESFGMCCEINRVGDDHVYHSYS